MSSETDSIEQLRHSGIADADLDAVRAVVGDVAAAPVAWSAFADLAAVSPYAVREIRRHPEWLTRISAVDAGGAVDSVIASIERALEEGTSLERALRETKRREALRIYLRELRGASVRQTTADIAALAEACLRVAVDQCARAAGNPAIANEFCVLGMGKLGGRELNFSSDVDLIFLCSQQAVDDPGLRQDATELARRVTDVMGAPTDDGYVFRVDLRLRPEGTQGALVHPLIPFCEYYLQFGQTWERSAMLKARPVAGNLGLGERALTRLEPFVYRRYLDYGALEELRAMKLKIEANADAGAVSGHDTADEPAASVAPERAPLAVRLKRRMQGHGRRKTLHRPPPTSTSDAEQESAPPDPDASGVLGWDVKIGRGGIREIEFFVQALQLVHCGTQPRLRVKNTLEALDVLLWAGLVPNGDHERLADAYDVLRRLEHRVQMAQDRQHHRLPVTWAGFDALARGMSMDRNGLRDRVLEHRQQVRTIFDRLFRGPDGPQVGAPTVASDEPAGLEQLVRLGAQQLAGQAALDSLSSVGFRRPRQVAGQLQVLREKSWGPFREAAWGRELTLARHILNTAASAPDPDQAVSHFSRFAHAVGDRPGYWTMLAENPHTTRLLLQVFGTSPYLSLALIRDPNAFERLLGVGSVAVEKSAGRLRSDLASRLDGVADPEHRAGIVRRFHREETLRIGLHETGGAAGIWQSLRQMSLLAETVIETTLNEVYQPLRTRRRRPGSKLPALSDVPFTVVAMGKLGGRELGFGSDLDIVFVYEELRQWKLEHTFYARLAQRLIRTLSSASVDGRMYEVDTRLRPSGTRGALVVSLAAFEDYYRSDAGTWERQALLRARPISGPPTLRASIDEIRANVLFDAPIGSAEITEIATMRERMNEAMYEPETRDVKFGPGALVDIEFAVQTLQLVHGAEVDAADGLRSTAIAQALDRLATMRPVFVGVADVYTWLSRLQARLRMRGDVSGSTLPADQDSLESLARGMGHQGRGALDAFAREFEQRTRRGRDFYDIVMGDE